MTSGGQVRDVEKKDAPRSLGVGFEFAKSFVVHSLWRDEHTNQGLRMMPAPGRSNLRCRILPEGPQCMRRMVHTKRLRSKSRHQ